MSRRFVRMWVAVGLIAGGMGAAPMVHPALSGSQLSAQVEITARSATIRLGGRMHAQYRSSSVDDASTNDFLIRRARITSDVTVGDFLTGRVMGEFAGSGAKLVDAYVRMNFDDAFRLQMGQFHRPFDPFELTSSTRIGVIERDGRIPGLDACTGVGGACSLSRFTGELEYAGRDIGIQADGTIGRLNYRVSMTNGTGTNTSDENDLKSFSGRVVVTATEDLSLGAFVGVHDFVVGEDTPAPDTEYATAFGGDLEWGEALDGFHAQFALVGGENWKNLDDTFQPKDFFTGQLLASYYFPIVSDRFEALEPVGRISWGDPDTDLDNDGGTLWTPGFMLYVEGLNRVGAGLDIYTPQTGDTEYSFKLQTYLYF